MDTRAKLDLLGQAARYDDCTVLASDENAEGRGFFAPATVDPRPPSRDMFPCVSHVTTPWGERKPVLKVLQTSACQNNCNYCAFRAGRDIRRAHLTPDELARSFDLMYRAGVVDGMFLSSGIIGTARTMDEMLATTELVRQKYGFRGYIHLKVLPGAEAAHIARAVELADRISVNLEGPTQDRLAVLAPQKAMAELIGPLRVAAKIIGRGDPARAPAPAGARPAPTIGHAHLGMSTQFVVGPAGESDRELLATVQMLYREVRLARAYYSAFSPVRNTPLEGVTPTHPTREHRLYQADWLLRYYHFDAEELPFDTEGQLSQDIDPKAAWAQAHPERFPIEVNAAPLPELLRIPGIGPSSAKAIVQARRQANLRELGDLRKLGARADRAAPFVTLGGHRPPYQPPLPLVG
ncbi:MAG: radical SAM protein [Anaerolineae bacterium]|jgi:predicted DNA-binding helix-hairpin-helix protein|nr:radical SAM protein [Anaerolineae bacterium]